jgi:hypothetical protein
MVLGDLMCVLARGRNLDGTGPVRVHIAEVVGEAFNVFLLEIR